ncbi:unnamed protein product, partial [Trichogramma brassicae]
MAELRAPAHSVSTAEVHLACIVEGATGSNKTPIEPKMKLNLKALSINRERSRLHRYAYTFQTSVSCPSLARKQMYHIKVLLCTTSPLNGHEHDLEKKAKNVFEPRDPKGFKKRTSSTGEIKRKSLVKSYRVVRIGLWKCGTQCPKNPTSLALAVSLEKISNSRCRLPSCHHANQHRVDLVPLSPKRLNISSFRRCFFTCHFCRGSCRNFRRQSTYQNRGALSGLWLKSCHGLKHGKKSHRSRRKNYVTLGVNGLKY